MSQRPGSNRAIDSALLANTSEADSSTGDSIASFVDQKLGDVEVAVQEAMNQQEAQYGLPPPFEGMYYSVSLDPMNVVATGSPSIG